MNRIAELLIRPGAQSRADARGLLRADARQLLVRIQAALKERSAAPASLTASAGGPGLPSGARKAGGLSDEARAHLADSAETLQQALAARLQRSGA